MKSLKITAVLLIMAFLLVSCEKVMMYNCETGE
jgi:hypothetical protein